jgi:serine/threonine-protein kinase
MTIADGIWFARTAAQASFSVSETGSLAYMNASLWDAELDWFDRTGRSVGNAGPPVRHEGLTPQLSSDDRSIAIARGELGREDVWVLYASGSNSRRLTFTPHTTPFPVWSSDGQRIMHTAAGRLLLKNVLTGDEEVMMDSIPGGLADWSRDGRYMVFLRNEAHSHLWYADLRDKVAHQYLDSPVNESQAQLSPDGRWIAYTSNESGHDEVYVQAFPHAGASGRSRQGAAPCRGGGATARSSSTLRAVNTSRPYQC